MKINKRKQNPARDGRLKGFSAANISSLAMPSTPKLTKGSRRKAIRYGIISGNIVLLAAIGLFVWFNRSANQTVRASTLNGLSSASSQSNPLDQLSADQIAYQAAQMTELPELDIIHNRADSAAILQSIVPNDTSTLAKPQLVSTAEKSRQDITFYTVRKHDDVNIVAAKFHVHADDIRFSNNITGDSLTTGAHLVIPPGPGIVYKVTNTDTIDGIISRYQANRNTFITVNDAENGNLHVGELIWIPNAVQPVATGFTSPNLFANTAFGAQAFAGSGEDNGYAFGWCTWWVAHRRAQVGKAIPSDWGDAFSWAAAAEQQGYTVSFRPQVYAVVWFPGINHVGFVESINSKGDVIMSEMNAVGWDTVDRRLIPASDTGNYKYIY